MPTVNSFFGKNYSAVTQSSAENIKDGVAKKEGENSLIQNNNFDKFRDFNAQLDKILNQKAVVSLQNPGMRHSAFSFQFSDSLDSQYLPLISDKNARLNQYRAISEFPEVDWCIDEICGDFLTVDNTGKFINMNFKEGIEDKLNDKQMEVLKDEFDRLIDLFDIKNSIYDIIRTYAVEGEVAWENIINHEIPSLGIIGVKKLRNEFFDLLIDSNNGNAAGIYFDLEKYAEETRLSLSSYYYECMPIFNTIYSTGMGGAINFNTTQNVVPLLWPQVTYFSYDKKSPNGKVTYSIIEKMKQAYYQLVLLQDAAVILRVTRAPLRLLFEVGTGGMSDKVAQDYIRKFGNSLKQKKTAKIDRQGNNSMIGNTYNPSTMLESWIFGKSNANDGTSVTQVDSTANYSEIDDLKLFLKRLIKQSGVPYTRYDNLESNSYRASTDLTQEEFDFAKMEVRIQMKFAQALKNTYITHLKLRGIWTQYQLEERDFSFEFKPPYVYTKYIAQQERTTTMEAYAAYADREELSKSWAMKKILGMTEQEISDMNKGLLLDKFIAAAGENLPEKLAEGTVSVDQINKLKQANLGSLDGLLESQILGGIEVIAAEGEEGEGDEGGDEDEGGDDEEI